MSKTLSDLPTDLHRLILSHDEEKIQLKKENEKLKKENERLQKQTGDLWELLVDANPEGCYIIPQLIEMRGESYVKEVFAEDYEDYKKTMNEEENEYPTCVECQDEKCIDFEDRLCHSCYHKSCKRAGDECWCACLDSDDPLKINDE